MWGGIPGVETTDEVAKDAMNQDGRCGMVRNDSVPIVGALVGSPSVTTATRLNQVIVTDHPVAMGTVKPRYKHSKKKHTKAK
jgi:hypothetical protein